MLHISPPDVAKMLHKHNTINWNVVRTGVSAISFRLELCHIHCCCGATNARIFSVRAANAAGLENARFSCSRQKQANLTDKQLFEPSSCRLQLDKIMRIVCVYWSCSHAFDEHQWPMNSSSTLLNATKSPFVCERIAGMRDRGNYSEVERMEALYY